MFGYAFTINIVTYLPFGKCSMGNGKKDITCVQYNFKVEFININS